MPAKRSVCTQRDDTNLSDAAAALAVHADRVDLVDKRHCAVPLRQVADLPNRRDGPCARTVSPSIARSH